tara:strand:+ start:2462 stop:2644 length:183 start_codon:yes stop_codon:yes gene_type:complete
MPRTRIKGEKRGIVVHLSDSCNLKVTIVKEKLKVDTKSGIIECLVHKATEKEMLKICKRK